MVTDLLYSVSGLLSLWVVLWMVGCHVPGTNGHRFCGWNYSRFTDRYERDRWRD